MTMKSVAKSYHFFKPPGLFTINSKRYGLNGWTKVQRRFFNPQHGIMAAFEHAGSVEARNREGGGLEVILTLPISEPGASGLSTAGSCRYCAITLRPLPGFPGLP